MNIKAWGFAAAIAFCAPLTAQAVTITGIDGVGNAIQVGAGNNNVLNDNLASLSVTGAANEGAGALQFDFQYALNASRTLVYLGLVPDGLAPASPGVKNLVIDFALNGGSAFASYQVTDASGIATALFQQMQPQITLLGNLAQIGDVLNISTTYDGFATTFSRFDVSVAAVPLPATALLMLTGVGGLGAMSRKRKSPDKT